MEIPALVRCIHLFYIVSMPHSHGVLSSAQVAFLAHEMVCSLSQTTINGGPVLQWRGPFFFLPTNPLHMAHIPNLWGRPIRLLERRHRGTQLATTSNLHFPAVAEAGLDMEFRISGAAQVQIALNILLNTDSPVCACCNKSKN